MKAIDKLIVCYNNEDFNDVGEILADECTYKSQLSFGDFKGREEVKNHLFEKSALAKGNNDYVIAKKVSVENNKEGIILKNSDDDCDLVLILIETEDDKIKSMSLCYPSQYKYKVMEM